MNKYLVKIILITAVEMLSGLVANATDFYGATVTDKNPPAVVWKTGITGLRPILSVVPFDSQAAKSGFKKGDIILAVNDKNVWKSVELSKFTTDKLSVSIFSDNRMMTLIIDRQAIESEQKLIIKAPHDETPPKQIAYEHKSADNSAPLVFKDSDLEEKFGKSEPVSSVDDSSKESSSEQPGAKKKRTAKKRCQTGDCTPKIFNPTDYNEHRLYDDRTGMPLKW